MSFTSSDEKSTVYAPGWFLADNEGCERKTRTIKQDDTQAKAVDGGGKYVPMGSIYPKNDTTAEGIVYEDVDVTTGDMPGSVVLKGTVYENRLPATLNGAAKTALEGKGFKFVTEATITRPSKED